MPAINFRELWSWTKVFFLRKRIKKIKINHLSEGSAVKKKSKVPVMAESVQGEGGAMTQRDKSRKAGHIKMFVIADLKSVTIDIKIADNIDIQVVIDSDNSTSYTNIGSLVKEHRPKVIPKNGTAKLLLWVHIAISNARRMLLDIFY
jgi:hypothetical protein